MAKSLCSPREEQYGRMLNSAKLCELEAEFQAIIDSKADNAARRCASLCLAREEVAAEEERRRQLQGFAGFPQAAREPRRLQPGPLAASEPEPPPLPRMPPSRALQAWTLGFFDEKTRAIGRVAAVEPVALRELDASAASPAEAGDSSDEDYEKILVSAWSLKDKVHALLQDEGERRSAAPVYRHRAQPRCDMRKVLEMSQQVKVRYRENERNEAHSGAKKRPSCPTLSTDVGASRPAVVRPAASPSTGSPGRRTAPPEPSTPPNGSAPPSAAPSTPRPMLPVVVNDFQWEPLGPCVCFQLALRNVDFAWLSASPSLVGSLEAGIKDAISEVALDKVQPSQIRLLMNAGPASSVTVKVTATPMEPEASAAEELRAALGGERAALSAAVLSRVGTTHGIGAATTGSLAVGQVGTPRVEEQPPSGTTPPAPPLWSTFSSSSPGSSAGARPALVERKAANEDLGKELAELAAQLRRSNIIGGMDGLID